MAISNVERTESEVQTHRRVVQIAEGGGKHADTMERHHARRWSLIGFPLHREHLVVDAVGNVRVARKAEQHLVENILEYKVLVIVRCRQLDVFEDKLVHNVIGGPDTVTQFLPVLDVLWAKRLERELREGE